MSVRLRASWLFRAWPWGWGPDEAAHIVGNSQFKPQVYTRSSLIEQTTPADLLIFDSNGTVDNPFFTGKARGFRNAYGSSMLRGEGCTMMKVMDFGSGGRSFTNLHEGCQDSGCLTLSWDFVWVAEPLFPFLGNPRSLRAS